MQKFVAVVVVALLTAGPINAWAAQKGVLPAVETAALKHMAAAIPLGSRVKVHTSAGRRLTATLLSVSDEEIVVKRDTRAPEPALAVRFDEMARLQRVEAGGGISIGKAVGIGLAAGAGAILTMFAIVFSFAD